MAEVTGGSVGPVIAPKGRRLAGDVIDLLLIPIVLGFLAGLILIAAPDALRNTILIIVNIGWLLFRDLIYSPGREMVGLKLISLTGDKVTPSQALIRNILLIIPFVLIIGYILELIMIIVKGERLEDGWAKARVTIK